jgi:hypothetical protein
VIDRRFILLLGVGATMAATALWHGPLGAANRFSGRIEQTARRTLDHYELPAIRARVEHGPLTRRVILSGPADDFQQAELVRIMGNIPGVGDVRWANPPVVPGGGA